MTERGEDVKCEEWVHVETLVFWDTPCVVVAQLGCRKVLALLLFETDDGTKQQWLTVPTSDIKVGDIKRNMANLRKAFYGVVGWVVSLDTQTSKVTRQVAVNPDKLDDDMLPLAAETIVSAAIYVNGEVWTLPPPARHCHIANAWCEAHYKDGENASLMHEEQGFVTSTGRFVERVEAGQIAIIAKQTHALRWPPNLFSEDLW